MTIPGKHLPNTERRRRFETLVLIHLDAAYKLARWLLKNDIEAQDLVQDAALRAYRHFDGMTGSAPRAWFMTIVRNLCFDHHASARAGLLLETYDEEQHDRVQSDGEAQAGTPEALAIKAQEACALNTAIRSLSWEFREVLVLREFESMSYKEISQVVGVPIGTVMSRLSRAREQLRLLLAPEIGTIKREGGYDEL